MKSYRVTIQQDENGKAFIEIPADIVAEYGLKDGDAAVFELRGDAVAITFPKGESQ